MEKVVSIIEKKVRDASWINVANVFKTFRLRAFLSQPARRKLVLHEMIAEMTSNVRRNCDRTLCDLTSGICTTIEYYTRQLKDLGNSPITQIEQAIQKGFACQRTGNGAGKLDFRRLLTV